MIDYKIHYHTEQWLNHSKDVYILFYDNNFVGHVYVENDNECHIIGGLYVIEKYRGNDFGKKLINEILINNKYSQDIYLKIDKRFEKLNKWYKSQGFNYLQEYNENFNWLKYDRL